MCALKNKLNAQVVGAGEGPLLFYIWSWSCLFNLGVLTKKINIQIVSMSVCEEV